MAHTLTNLLVHIIFSTKERVARINERLELALYPYVGGIARESGAQALIVNGMPDHLHTLVRIPASMSVAEIVRLIKSNSTKWIHESFPDQRLFQWQSGYAGFSVSESNQKAVARYIADQKEHHRKMSFQEKILQFLKKNRVEYDERFLWG